MENPKLLVSDEAIVSNAKIQSDAVFELHKNDGEAGERARGYITGGVHVRDLYEKDRAEKDKTIADLREALERLIRYYEPGENRPEAVAKIHDAKHLLSTLPKPQL